MSESDFNKILTKEQLRLASELLTFPVYAENSADKNGVIIELLHRMKEAKKIVDSIINYT